MGSGSRRGSISGVAAVLVTQGAGLSWAALQLAAPQARHKGPASTPAQACSSPPRQAAWAALQGQATSPEARFRELRLALSVTGTSGDVWGWWSCPAEVGLADLENLGQNEPREVQGLGSSLQPRQSHAGGRMRPEHRPRIDMGQRCRGEVAPPAV